MRRPIETAPRNGVFVILEDATHGTFAVARWSVEAAQWLDDDAKPLQFDATHWNLPQNLNEQITPRRPDATDRHPHVSAGDTTEQPQRISGPRSSVIRSRPIRRGRSIAAMAACLLVGAAMGPLLYRSDLGVKILRPTASDNNSGLKQALEQEQERTNRLAGDVTAAQREVESQTALLHQASEGADRQKEASDRDLAELRQALQLERSRTETLTGQLAKAQRDGAAQTALARRTIDDVAKERERVIAELRQTLKQQEDQTIQARRKAEAEVVQAKQASIRIAEALQQERDKVEELRGALAAVRREGEAQAATWRSASSEATRSAEAQSQALQEAQGKTEKLAAELAAVRREIQTQISVADSAKVQAAGIKETAERSTDEQRRALQQEQDRIAKLTAELAETRSNLQTQTKAKAAEDVARENHLTTAREELQKAKADAAAARESLEAERSRTEQIEQRLVTIEAAGQPSAMASSVTDARTKASADDTTQSPRSAPRSEASVDQASSHAIRLIARANLLLDQGNIGAARNMLDRAAEMGSAEALFWLAETYDPLLLPTRKTFGTQSDIAKARDLYGKALAGGVSEARLRLDALQQ